MLVDDHQTSARAALLKCLFHKDGFCWKKNRNRKELVSFIMLFVRELYILKYNTTTVGARAYMLYDCG
jgi:hypothetical protein